MSGSTGSGMFQVGIAAQRLMLSSLSIKLPPHVDLLTTAPIYQGISKYRRGANHPDAGVEPAC